MKRVNQDLSHVKPNKAAGARIPLIDGIEKVSGKAKYTTDLDAHGALVGVILRSPYAHAEIVNIDVSAARALPGVKAVITGDDCGAPFGILPISENEYPLAKEKLRYRGDAVAAVEAGLRDAGVDGSRRWRQLMRRPHAKPWI